MPCSRSGPKSGVSMRSAVATGSSGLKRHRWCEVRQGKYRQRTRRRSNRFARPEEGIRARHATRARPRSGYRLTASANAAAARIHADLSGALWRRAWSSGAGAGAEAPTAGIRFSRICGLTGTGPAGTSHVPAGFEGAADLKSSGPRLPKRPTDCDDATYLRIWRSSRPPDRQLPIRVQLDEAARDDFVDPDMLPQSRLNTGQTVPLGRSPIFDFGEGPTTIERYGSQASLWRFEALDLVGKHPVGEAGGDVFAQVDGRLPSARKPCCCVTIARFGD